MALGYQFTSDQPSTRKEWMTPWPHGTSNECLWMEMVFHSIATRLLQLASNGDSHALAVLKDGSMEIEQLVSHLGKLQSLSGSSPTPTIIISSSLPLMTNTHDQLLAEAPRSLQRGAHCGDMGEPCYITAIAKHFRRLDQEESAKAEPKFGSLKLQPYPYRND